ncbi:CU044_5270 family protein [Actinomadura macrotermitis]|uniref:CU044_5270 family protein n=1 Tax=Actinomadura macrotermitis TaxID=2585200 RepID=A0A7K0BME1_9ACTN|nr:CU044_5270 family protein [Actinomadura macrotermitis]MQY02350.1 hypothetical protein [Actinomadura macrotermitis]
MTFGAKMNRTDAEHAFRALKPAALERTADEIHGRRRDTDLARAMQDTMGREPRPARTRSRRPILVIAGVTAAGVAAAGAAVLTAGDGGGSHRGPATVAQAPLDARTFLLTAAHTAEKAPLTTGAYYYNREREQALIRFLGKRSRRAMPTGNAELAKLLPFHVAYVTKSQDSWNARRSPGLARTIVGIDRKITFRSAADEAAWRALGSPELEDWSAKPHTNNYDFRDIKPSASQRRDDPGEIAKLPADERSLTILLHRWHDSDEKAARGHDGVGTGMSYTDTVFSMAPNLLSGAARPGTRAAFFRILAGEPGITLVRDTTDLLGRPAVALVQKEGKKREHRYLIDPATTRYLGHEAYMPEKPDGPPVRMLASAIQAEGWVRSLGARP